MRRRPQQSASEVLCHYGAKKKRGTENLQAAVDNADCLQRPAKVNKSEKEATNSLWTRNRPVGRLSFYVTVTDTLLSDAYLYG